MRPEKDHIDEIATEMAVDPAFVEKDWFAVQLIELITEIQSDIVKPVFSGGTCLSKAYEVIKRFSEDVDFRGISEGETRSDRKDFRETVLQKIQTSEDFEISDVVSQDKSRYFKVDIQYPQYYGNALGLRPHLLLEFKLGMQARRPVQQKRISSFIGRYTGQSGQVDIDCIDPLEIAADKFSALLWRISSRDRQSSSDDPAMIRHLHDLAYLYEGHIQQHSGDFYQIIGGIYEADMRRGDLPVSSVSATAGVVLDKLKNDQLYQSEYESFVDSMSYAADDENIRFETARRAFESIMSGIPD